MDVIDAIKLRRSDRKYKDTKVDENILRDLINSARLAPSGNNAQPSRFKIINQKDQIELLRKNKIFFQDFVYDSPAIIVCCADTSSYKPATNIESNESRATRDLSIASAFLILRATELGLGSCYIGWMDKVKIKDVLKLPKSYIVPYVITIGYSCDPSKRTTRKKLDEIIL